MRLIRRLLFALAAITVVYGMEGPTDDVVGRTVPVGKMGAPRVVSLRDGSERSDTPFMKKNLF